MWKTTRNTLNLYNMRKKGPFGRIKKVKLITEENVKKEVNVYYEIVNEFGDIGKFKSSLMNPLMVGINPFSKKIAELRSNGNDQKVGVMLSQLVCSKEFSYHDPNVHGDLGLKLGEEEAQEQFGDLFVAARENATVVTAGSYEEAVEHITEKGNLKKKPNLKKAPKLNKDQRIEKFFVKSVTEGKGVEQEYIQSIQGRLDLHIGKLKVSDKIQLPVNETEIRQMANEMVDLLDLTQLYFVVMPSEPENFDQENLQNNDFVVLHGRHRLLALQLLDKENRLTSLPFMEKKTVPCLILGILSDGAANWANLRGSEIAARYVARPNHHDLLYEMNGLKKLTDDGNHVLETVTRYCNLLKKSEAEKAALRSFSKLPRDALDLVIEVLQVYEKYQTADVDEKLMKKSASKLRKGEKLITTMAIFKPLSLMPAEYIRECCPKILDGKLKLKDVVGEYSKVIIRRKKEGMIEKIAGFKSITALRNQYPDRFTPDILDKLSVNPESNTTPIVDRKTDASQLENYTKSVVKPVGEESCRASLPPDKSLRKIELESDVKELRGLVSRAKSDRVKEAVTKIVRDFEAELSEYVRQPEVDEYEFNDSGIDTMVNSTLKEKDVGFSENEENDEYSHVDAEEDSETYSDGNDDTEDDFDGQQSRSLLATQIDGHCDLMTDLDKKTLLSHQKKYSGSKRSKKSSLSQTFEGVKIRKIDERIGRKKEMDSKVDLASACTRKEDIIPEVSTPDFSKKVWQVRRSAMPM